MKTFGYLNGKKNSIFATPNISATPKNIFQMD